MQGGIPSVRLRLKDRSQENWCMQGMKWDQMFNVY